jgi:hypothetical protein
MQIIITCGFQSTNTSWTKKKTCLKVKKLLERYHVSNVKKVSHVLVQMTQMSKLIQGRNFNWNKIHNLEIGDFCKKYRNRSIFIFPCLHFDVMVFAYLLPEVRNHPQLFFFKRKGISSDTSFERPIWKDYNALFLQKLPISKLWILFQLKFPLCIILGYKVRKCIIIYNRIEEEFEKSRRSRDFSTSEILLWHLITVRSITFFAQSPIRQELTMK